MRRVLVLAILLRSSSIGGVSNWVVQGENGRSESLESATIEVKGLNAPVSSTISAGFRTSTPEVNATFTLPRVKSSHATGGGKWICYEERAADN